MSHFVFLDAEWPELAGEAKKAESLDSGALQAAIVVAPVKGGLETSSQAAPSACRPSLTAASHDSHQNMRAGMIR